MHFKSAIIDYHVRLSWHHSPGRAGHDIVNVRSLEAVEGGRGSHSVGTHVFEDQPITDLQVRQVTLLNNAIKAITSWAPDTAGVHGLIWLWFLLVSRNGEGRRDKTLTICFTFN